MSWLQRLWEPVSSFITLVGIYAMEPLVAVGPAMFTLLVMPPLFVAVATVLFAIALVRVCIHTYRRRRTRPRPGQPFT